MSIDTRAYLSSIRNVRKGLLTRTRIIQALEPLSHASVSAIAKEVGVTYSTVLYHLQNMKRDGIVDRNPESMNWFLLVDQKPLSAFFRTVKKQRKIRRGN